MCSSLADRFSCIRKRVDHYFHAFFIPIFRLKKGQSYHQCSHCGYVPETQPLLAPQPQLQPRPNSGSYGTQPQVIAVQPRQYTGPYVCNHTHATLTHALAYSQALNYAIIMIIRSHAHHIHSHNTHSICEGTGL